MGLFSKRSKQAFDRDALAYELSEAINHLARAREIMSYEEGATAELLAIKREAASEALVCINEMKKSAEILKEIIPPQRQADSEALFNSLKDTISRLSRAALDCHGFPVAVKKSAKPLSAELARKLDEATKI